MYCYISDYTIDILDHVVESKNSGNYSLIQIQFPINVRAIFLKACVNNLAISRSVVLLMFVIVSYMVQQQII